MNKAGELKYVANERARKQEVEENTVAFLNRETVKRVRAFHQSFPQYEVTPLHSLNKLAGNLGVNKIWVKDESFRFGLNAFKVLGGSYAAGRVLAEKLDREQAQLTFGELNTDAVKARLGEVTFVTATDGNHGRGIAWAAQQLGQKSVVFMPRGSSETRLNNIIKEGADASITSLNYDDAVRWAGTYAVENNGTLVQDSAWEGYEQIPVWIMQGYCTLIDEALEQIRAEGEDAPTHVFLQAGVGSFAASMLGYLLMQFGADRPVTVIVEPEEAACIYRSAAAGDGKPHAVEGDMPTIMAGLACGEPSTVAWPLLREYADLYISCPDYTAANGMRILGNPLEGDPKVISGESGAVGLGVLSSILARGDQHELAERLKLDQDAKILLISTEGDTDPESYREIVWNGSFSGRQEGGKHGQG
ncbi:diaminopropionate ammonia-lyase [Paenibacillus typhae]|uniref:diaminopropionate ammonia-lyase n=1 Tax=Paenibacillus typhae TaxID=1174501 RepID=UPI001C8D96A1|nr:diaminopropionate ammonia-lyase [Paenibacillus typhae]MBY0011597.1 diaminopropionate ammonia-lyase [Paenibacillus typhae]